METKSISCPGPSKSTANARIPIVLRTDSDSIFKSADFCKYCQDNATDLEFSSPGDQFFNGKVEHLIGILKIKMFTVLKAANLGLEYWLEALALCVYTYNRMPTKANEDFLSLYHIYRGKPPRIGHLRGFGCDCTYWGRKSMSKGSGRPGVFLGYIHPVRPPVPTELESRATAMVQWWTADT